MDELLSTPDTNTDYCSDADDIRFAVKVKPGQTHVLVRLDMDLMRRQRETWEFNELIRRKLL